MLKNNKGFTLAEVLITLTIIGIIASITIPALLGGTDDLEYKVALKKGISALNQALKMNVALNSSNGGTLTTAGLGGDAVADSATTASTNAGDIDVAEYFGNYLNVTNNVSALTNSKLNAVDGITYYFKHNTGAVGCGVNASTIATFNRVANVSNTTCYVLIDVNGDKGPNMLSTGSEAGSDAVYRDRYYAIITGNSVIPAEQIGADAMYN